MESADGNVDRYRCDLEAAAAQQLERPWPDCWPTWTSRDLRNHHSRRRAMISPVEAIEQAKIDRSDSMHSACMIENISMEWAVELGAAWDIPVDFFMEYLKPMNSEGEMRMIDSGGIPGEPGGVQSTRGDRWATIRGVVDYGLLGEKSRFDKLSGSSIRTSGRTAAGRQVQDTRMSCFKVHEKLGTSPDLLLPPMLQTADEFQISSWSTRAPTLNTCFRSARTLPSPARQCSDTPTRTGPATFVSHGFATSTTLPLCRCGS